ncbi:heat shock protein 27-like [Condylostylus longicornis]|uniref:heat shock protein 27-like n=1 Tax=Condylostylus longicornis TaxID=2530218 RepID=UPI00244E5627|nr:heat shock protein 27-like [Condylostylus longicornis]
MSLVPFKFRYDNYLDRFDKELKVFDNFLDRFWYWDRYGLEFDRYAPRSLLYSDQESHPVYGKDGFHVAIDCIQFRPSEITVKTFDNEIIIEGKHEERPDNHGYISRAFVRKYILPDYIDSGNITSSLSSDGILTIKAPPLPPKRNFLENKERYLPITYTGPSNYKQLTYK